MDSKISHQVNIKVQHFGCTRELIEEVTAVPLLNFMGYGARVLLTEEMGVGEPLTTVPVSYVYTS